MNFDDLKVIWDSQSEQPLYAVDQKGLQTMLNQKTQKFNRMIRWQVIQSYGSSLFVVGMIALFMTAYYSGLFEKINDQKMTQWDTLALFTGAGCWLYFAGSIFVKRRKQKQSETKQATNLREEIERDIQRVDGEIQGRKNVRIAFIPPHIGAMLFIWVFFKTVGISLWGVLPYLVIAIIGFVFESRCQDQIVERELIPRKQELESLRNKLAHQE